MDYIYDVSQVLTLMFEIIYIREGSLDPLMLESLVRLWCAIARRLEEYLYNNYIFAQKISYQIRVVE